MRGAKSANSELFKDFCNQAEMEKNIQTSADRQVGGLYLIIVPNFDRDVLTVCPKLDNFMLWSAEPRAVRILIM